MGLEFKVIKTNKMLLPEIEPLGIGDVQLGETDLATQVVRVRRDMSTERQGLTMLHEILHIVGEHETLPERMLSRMAVGLYSTLTENGLLVEGWMDKIIDENEKEELDDHEHAIGSID